MDEKISNAIAQVMGGIEKLSKDDTNKHANYKFASIDAFLEEVRPLMAKANLVIDSDEEDFEVIAGTKVDQRGNEVDDSWLKMRYAFYIYCQGATHGPRYRTTMVRASMGSQAFGAAQSYAEKQFLRSLFKIATGEGGSIDADSHEQSNLPQRSQSRQPAKPKLVSEAQVGTLRFKLTEANASEAAFLDHIKLDALSNMRADKYDDAVALIESRKPKADAKPEAADLISDEIPHQEYAK